MHGPSSSSSCVYDIAQHNLSRLTVICLSQYLRNAVFACSVKGRALERMHCILHAMREANESIHCTLHIMLVQNAAYAMGHSFNESPSTRSTKRVNATNGMCHLSDCLCTHTHTVRLYVDNGTSSVSDLCKTILRARNVHTYNHPAAAHSSIAL